MSAGDSPRSSREAVIQTQQPAESPVMEVATAPQAEVEDVLHRNQRQQEEATFDLDGWPDGVKRPIRVCGIHWNRVKLFPISPIFCCMK
jgi:hypothetical protein